MNGLAWNGLKLLFQSAPVSGLQSMLHVFCRAVQSNTVAQQGMLDGATQLI